MLKLIIWYEINLGLLYKTAFKGKFILLWICVVGSYDWIAL